jgi:hypothetical protein
MKKMMTATLLTLLFSAALVLSLTNSEPAQGQILLTNLRVKIVAVERKDNRLQVRVHDGGNKDIQYIEIDSNTRFSRNNLPVSYDQAWASFRKDMIIRVKGGYTMSIHVKAKQIWW